MILIRWLLFRIGRVCILLERNILVVRLILLFGVRKMGYIDIIFFVEI